MFDAFVSYRNDVGLLGEENDPRSGEALGNFPQAYSSCRPDARAPRNASPHGLQD
jgi:GH15 family glucan-1,4-alpha-glucosidase